MCFKVYVSLREFRPDEEDGVVEIRVHPPVDWDIAKCGMIVVAGGRLELPTYGL